MADLYTTKEAIKLSEIIQNFLRPIQTPVKSVAAYVDDILKLNIERNFKENSTGAAYRYAVWLFAFQRLRVEKFEDLTVSEFLDFCNKGGISIPPGLSFLIPNSLNYNYSRFSVDDDFYIKARYSHSSNSPISNKNAYYNGSDYFQYLKQVGTKASGFKNISIDSNVAYSYFKRIPADLDDDKKYSPAPLPVIPEEFSETNNANFNPVSLMGRSVDYQIYEGSSREVSFTLKLHQELFSSEALENDSGTNNIYNIVRLIESSCYPYYEELGWAGPPQVIFKIGNQFYIRGILTSCSVSWKLPMDSQGYYNNCDLSVSVKETSGPWGALDIAQNKDNGIGMGSYRDGKTTFGREG